MFGGGSSDVSGALTYAKAHAPGSRWTLIVSSETTAAPYVIKGESVAAMGCFTGRETVLTHAFLAKLVRSGEARYFLVGGGGGFGGGGAANNSAVQTIASICKQVPAASWSTASASSGGSGLYDCAGKADAIAAAG